MQEDSAAERSANSAWPGNESPVRPTEIQQSSRISDLDEKMISENCLEPGEDETCERVSICTVRLKYSSDHDNDISSKATEAQDNEILSVERLISDHHPERSTVGDNNNMIEINLMQDHQAQEIKNTSDHDGTSHTNHISKLTQKYPYQKTQQNNPICGGFEKAELRMSFANQRMREYFESYRIHTSERARLYQFFKSIRTELLACLLFTVISSQALIVCRTHLFDSDTIATRPRLQLQHTHDHQLISQPQLGRSVGRQAALVHIVSGLVSSFAVASLTQVFGHISGCHLIPSVSVALYVKGHISRARLASYLAAQSVGSMLGVGLLGLLTTSQVTPEEFREMLHSLAQSKYSGSAEHSKLGGEFSNGPTKRTANITSSARAKKRREVADSISNLNETFLGKSEITATATILRSSMAERHKLDKRQRANQTGSAAYKPRRTITANVSTSQVVQPGQYNTPSTMDALVGAHLPKPLPENPIQIEPSSSAIEVRNIGEPSALDIARMASDSPPAKSRQVLQSSSTASAAAAAPPDDRSRCDHRHACGILTMRTKMDDRNGSERHPDGLNPYEGRHNDSGSGFAANFRESRRNRRQVSRSDEVPPDKVKEGSEASQVGANHNINLLEFALPDRIMSSESIRQCINRQVNVGRSLSDQQPAEQTKRLAENDEIGRLASSSFDHCLSLSNASQMFIFQLLATLIIVLSYLVNVDPRRIDPGFKSLSIGLSYFVASITTVSIFRQFFAHFGWLAR